MIYQKSKEFAVRAIKLYQYLQAEKHETVLSKQVLRSGTSIGANCAEAAKAQSKAEFVSKMNTALKEAAETCYWLDLLVETEYISQASYESMYADAEELLRLLTSIIKTSNQRKKQE